MDATTFNSRKMRWLNGINADCNISSTSFRVAYAIADHLNRVVGCAWPSNARIAKRICVSSKSISRAVAELETQGWLKVKRSRKSTNEYRIAWPNEVGTPERVPIVGDGDKTVPPAGHFLPEGRDKNVPLSYLKNLPKTYSSRLGEEKGARSAFRDQGTYEQRIVERFGPTTWDLLSALAERDPGAVERLCHAERLGKLTQSDMDAAHLAVMRTSRGA
jgi:hypothetical protein